MRFMTCFCVLSLTLILTGFCGCNQSPYKSLPAPPVDSFPYELTNVRNLAMLGGDNFQIHDGVVVHCLILEGIDSPKPGQDYFLQSKRHVYSYIKRKKFRVVLLGYDEMKREIARVYVDDLNVNLEMVKAGMAWWDGCEFEGSDEIKAAESAAREAKIGLWRNPNPVHPSEFDANDN